ncbi:divergent polysaccharide deacetylase family protein [Pseudooceanicola sp. 502str34]
MVRGLIAGIFWGVIISALAVAVTSLNGTAHQRQGAGAPAEEAADPEPGSTSGSEPVSAPGEGSASGTGAETAEVPEAPVEAAAPSGDMASEPPESPDAGAAPAVAPEGADASAEPEAAPDTAGDSAATTSEPEPAEEDATQATMPETAPAEEASTSPSAPEATAPPALTATAPAIPDSLPEAPASPAEGATPEAPATADAPLAAPQPVDLTSPGSESTPGQPDLPARPETDLAAPEAPAGTATAEQGATGLAAAPAVTTPAPDLPAAPGQPSPDQDATRDPAPARPQVDTAPGIAGAPALAQAAPALPGRDSVALPEATPGLRPAAPEGEQMAEAQTDTPPPPAPRVLPRTTDDTTAGVPRLPGAPAGTLSSRMAEGVTGGRLPAVGSAEAPVADTPDVAADPTPAAEDGPAINRFAAAFANPEDKPLMSIVLIDDGSSPIGLAALANFPYPLSFAIDPAWSGATEAMERYRAEGFEVMILANLPEAATAMDAETAMEDWRRSLPQAVGVMEGDGTGVQASRAAADQLTGIAAGDGLGLLLYPNGLDTVRKMAVREGVPAATLFRDFDDDGQDATVIRRFLDHAAFRAGQEGAVIMVGRMRADTISALLLWGLQDRASRVALAPVSAALKAGGVE